MVIWNDPAIQAAVVQSAGAVIAAAIAAVCAAIVGKQFADRKKLQEMHRLAQEDIAFLLAVEEAHCNMHAERGEGSYKHRIRRMVRTRGLTWSGRFTPGRVQSTYRPH